MLLIAFLVFLSLIALVVTFILGVAGLIFIENFIAVKFFGQEKSVFFE